MMFRLLCGLAAVTFNMTAVQAATPLLDAPGTAGQNTISYTLGYELTTGSSGLSVSSLGLWDQNGDGLAGAHNIGLYNASGGLLGQVTVTAGTGSTLVGGFRYADLLAPLTLLPNTTYVLAAAYNSEDVYSYYDSFSPVGSHVSGGVTIGFGRYEAGSTLQFPTTTTSARYTGPNFLYTAVPEPTALLPLAGLAMLLRRRR